MPFVKRPSVSIVMTIVMMYSTTNLLLKVPWVDPVICFCCCSTSWFLN